MSQQPFDREGSGRGWRRIANLLAAGFFLGLAIYVYIETGDYPESLMRSAPGPAFFPRLLAMILGGLALILAGRALAGSTSPGDVTSREGLGKICLSLAVLVGFLLSLPYGDIFLTLPLLLASVMAIMGERRWSVLLTAPLLFDLFVYVVFYRFFSVDLPTVYF